MILSLCFICVVIVILIYIKYNINTNAISNSKTTKCKNELINYISPQKMLDNKYLIRNLDGLSISYDINNLQQNIFYTRRQTTFNIENKWNYYYIYTDTKPRLYLNTNINGEIRFKLEKNIKGNKWLFLKLDTDDLLKRMLVNEVKKNKSDSSFIYDKYNFIYNNGYFIQSFDYSYYITNSKCDLCPNLRNILIISIK
jgi:hypothetical protein